MLDNRIKLIVLIICVLLSVAIPLEASAPLDGVIDSVLLYQRGYACNLSADKPLPFFLLVDQTGTGYLIDYRDGNRFDRNQSDRTVKNGIPTDWIDTMKDIELSKQLAWTRLDLSTARAVWEGSSTHTIFGRKFFTFDAMGYCTSDEKNLYHVDLQVDRYDQVIGYRVRGIGICDARWVVKVDQEQIKLSN